MVFRVPTSVGALLGVKIAGPKLFIEAHAQSSNGTRLLRSPTVSATQIAFAYAQNIWTVPRAGGSARRLTSFQGQTTNPHFSPDGKWIAFSGEYAGNFDVFVVPGEGGEPRRLTWHPGADQVVGWTLDGARVLFRSRAENPQAWELFAIRTDGSEPEKLPVGWASRIDMDPKSGLWAFNRVTSEGRTWKRYRGGMATDIWVGDPKKGDFKKIGDFAGPQEFPMWHAGRIYFVCDQGGTGNLWSMNPDGSGRKRHTDFKEWDARWPAMGRDGRIAFTLGGDLEVFNSADESVRKVDVQIPSDRPLTRSRYPDAAQTLTSFGLAPKGDRLVVVTRGEIFAVPVKDGPTLP